MNHLREAILFYREQAQIIFVLATKEPDKPKQRILFAISEHYYMLHDQLTELEKMCAKARAGLPSGGGHSSTKTLTDELFAISRDPFSPSFFNDNDPLLELVYVANMDGKVIACQADSWSQFCLGNGAQELANGVGLNVFASCSDGPTASAYRIIHALLQAGRLDQYSFSFRCDSPERARLFRMTMEWLPMVPGGAVMYRSQLLSERQRPAVALLRRDARNASNGLTVKICSFCQAAWEPIAARWVESERHPAADDGEATTTNGVCGECHDHIVAPLISKLAVAELSHYGLDGADGLTQNG